MGRTICVWLIACMALASAIPVPGPTSEQDILHLIRNAKPEDNDIAFQFGNLIDDVRFEKQDPTITDLTKPQEPIPHGTEEQAPPQSEEPQEIPEVQQVQDVSEQDQEVPKPEIQIEPEPISVPEEDQMQTKPEEEDLQIVPEEVIPLPEEQPVQTETEEEQIFPVPEEEDLQIVPEEVIPLPEELPVQTETEEEQIFPVPEEEDLQIVPEEVVLLPEERPVQTEPEEEQIFPGPGEQLVPLQPEEELIISVSEDEEASPVYAEEPGFPVIEEEQIIREYEEDNLYEPYEVQIIPIHEDETEFRPESEEILTIFGNEEQVPIAGEPEDFPEVIVVGLEETEFNQPKSDEHMVPGYVMPEIQPDAVIPRIEIQDSRFDTPYFEEEESQEDFPSMHDESQGPVYFDTFSDPEPLPVDIFGTPEDYMEEPVEMPVEEMPPFVVIDISEDQVPNSEILSSDVGAPIILVNDDHPYPYGEDYRPGDDALEDYYIPESDLPVEDPWYENPESSFPADEDDVFEIDDFTPEEENTRFPLGHVLEILPTMEARPEEMTFEHDSQNFHGEVPFEEFFIPKPVEHVVDDTIINEEPSPLLEIIDVLDSEEDQMPDLDETIFMIEPEGSEEPTLEVIHMGPQNPDDSFPFEVPMLTDHLETKPMNTVIPPGAIKHAVQQIFANEQIVPIAEFSEEEITPIIIGQETYWVPENPNRQPIIFPEEAPPRHNLPVFPYQWSEENFFQPPRSDHVHSHDLHEHLQAPSYGPPPQYPPMMEQPQTMFDMPNDDISPKMPDFMPHSEVSDMPREDTLPLFDINNTNRDSPSGHFPLRNEFYQNSRVPGFPKRFNNPSSFEPSSLPDITFQQDFHGPNTFPLNFRRPDFTPENINRENIYPESSVTPNDFQQRLSNLPSFHNAMSSTPNMFFPMLNEPEKMLENPHEQNMNMNLQVFRASPMPMNSERLQQRQQQFDVQVSFVPYDNDYNFRPYAQYGHHDSNYPYTQHTNNFNTYQESSYSVPPYGGSNSYPNTGLYPSSPIPDRYAMNYDYRGQYDYYHPYNYPTPTW